jgi:hypothetical protein
MIFLILYTREETMSSIASVRTLLTGEMALVKKIVIQEAEGHGWTLPEDIAREFERVTEEMETAVAILCTPDYPNRLTVELNAIDALREFREKYLPPLRSAA